MRDFLAAPFRVINGGLRGLVRTFTDILGGIGGVVASDFKGLLGAVCPFNNHSFAVFADLGNRAVDALKPILADLVDFGRRINGAFLGVMHYNFGTLRQALEAILRSRGGFVGAPDGGLVDKVDGMLGAIFGFYDHGLCTGIQFRDGPMDGRNDIIRCSGNENQQCSHNQKSKQIFHCAILPQIHRYRFR